MFVFLTLCVRRHPATLQRNSISYLYLGSPSFSPSFGSIYFRSISHDYRCSQSVIKESLKRTGVPEEDAREFSSQCVLHLLLKCVFLGSLLDDLPSSDSRRTYLWSPSEDPPHPFFSVAQRCTSENTPHLLCRLPVHPPMSAVIRNLRHTLSTPRTANLSRHGCTHPPRLQIQPQSTVRVSYFLNLHP
ncbi:hypothetical protein ILYODFUR_013882 [Ilyodon furcidens]|uniref:Uncharacterized protein n=1 Tax=Ilyodon furcidens TaxID=33524 RepID=A0ABV0VDS2_9TELE